MAEIVPNKVPCGKKVDPQPTPTPEPVVLCELDGVTYFKLRSDIPGDYTKNCGLLGDEIDKNFYFLRSMDIMSAHTVIEDNRKYLVLERINCGKDIKVDITDEDSYSHNFRVEDGYIYVRYPDGIEDPIRDGNGQIGDGNPVKFLMEGSHTRVVTDASIAGDGLFTTPLALDLAYRTGTYAPADFYADLTCPDVNINDVASGIGYGHAVVTRENTSRFGRLYTWRQAMAINAALAKEGRGWRVPTREDWGKMLNWAELKPSPCADCDGEPANFNHDTDKSGNFGCNAGARLKSTVLWENKEKNTDDFRFTIYPVGICPEDYNTKEPNQYGFTGLYKVSTFWTSSTGHTGEPYVRTFSYGHDDVAQFTESPAKRFSIRLVRDIQDDFDVREYEEILGTYVPVVLMTDGKQQWTQYNIDFTEYDGYRDEEVTVPEAWKDVNTDIPAVVYYEKLENDEGELYYDFANPKTEYELPSNINIDELDRCVSEKDDRSDVPEPTTASTDYIAVDYIIHLDMASEPKFYYNAWDGNMWHKKMMREGESVVIIGEDAETGCDTAATPYVTSANTNHEWRIFLNEETGLDELTDTLEALKREIQKELDKLSERIDDLSATTEEFSAATVEEIARLDEKIDDETARAISAETELHERINSLEIASAETPDETILASYILREGPDGEQKGVRIDIPKDKNIKSISTGWSGAVIDAETGEFTYDPESGDTEVVRVVYQKNDGLFELVEIDIEDFIHENEFEDGLEVIDHAVKVKIDPASDWFLTVSMSGVSLTGVDKTFDNIALDIIGAEGSSESGYSIDLYDSVWTEVTREECEEHPHEIVAELPDPKTWTGTTYIEVAHGQPITSHTYYKKDSSTNYISGSDTIVDALEVLDTALKEESDRAQAAEQALGEKIDAETERAISAETVLHEEIIAETERATTAEEDLQRQINEEVSARTAADEDLQRQIDEEVSARTAADELLQQHIDEEASARTAADEALQEQIDELKSKAIEPLDESIVIEVSGNTTYVGVALDPEDEHIKLGPNGLWIDPDFGEFGE